MIKNNPSTIKAYPQTKKFIRRIQARHMQLYGTRPSYERILIAIERLFEFDKGLYDLLLTQELK